MVSLTGGLVALTFTLANWRPAAEVFLQPTAISAESGHAYQANLSELTSTLFVAAGDDNDAPARSALVLTEDGRRLGPAHTSHDTIRQDGRGAYSHWGSVLYFSSSDGTDPRRNGRTYRIEVERAFARSVIVAAGAATTALSAMVLVGVVRRWRARRATRQAATSMWWGWLAGPTVTLCTVAAGLGAWWPGYREVAIPASAITVDDGLAYHVGALTFDPPWGFEVRSDTNDSPRRSQLVLLEGARAFGRPHTSHDLIRLAGRGSYSHWGDGLYFSTPDGSDPRINGRTYRARAPLAMATPVRIVLAMGLTAWLLTLRRLSAGTWRRLRQGLSWSNASPTTFGVLGMAALVYFGTIFSTALPLPSGDSPTYVMWEVPFRTPGYPSFLSAFDLVFTGQWQQLPTVQAIALVAGMTVLAAGVGVATRSWLAAVLVLVAVTGLDGVLQYAQAVLTEAVFCAAVFAAAGLALTLVERPRRRYALGAGVLMAFTCAVKPVAMAMPIALAPAALAFRPGRRLVGLGCLLLPAVLYQGGYAAFASYRYGSPSSSLGAFALFGHVAWAVTPDQPSRYPELTRHLAAVAAPVVARRPPIAGLADYVLHTTNEYNALLWGATVPAAQKWLSLRGEPSDREAVGLVLMTIAKETIAAHPIPYARHVIAHYVGGWDGIIWPDNLFMRFKQSTGEAVAAYQVLPDMWRPRLGVENGREASFVIPSPADQPALPQERLLASLTGPDVTLEWLVLKVRRVTWAGSLLVLLVLLPVLARDRGLAGPVTRLLTAAAMVSALVNGYFLTHAMAQVYLTRYAGVMAPLTVALFVLQAALVARIARGAWRGPAPAA